MALMGLCILVLLSSMSCHSAPSASGTGTNHGKEKAESQSQKATRDVPSETPQRRATAAMFRGSPARVGQAAVSGPRAADLKWVFRTQGRIYADVVFGPDRTLYVASHDHYLYAVGPDGREKWSFDTGGKIWSTPAVAEDGTIYVGSDSDRLFALSKEGDVKWVFPTSPAKNSIETSSGKWDVDTSPLLLDDGTVVFGCHYYLYALRPSGLLRWYFQAGVEKTKIFSSAAMAPDGTLYFGTQGGYVFALNQSAKVLWYKKIAGDTDSTPVVDEKGVVYFASDDGNIRAFVPGGQLKWIRKIGDPMRAPLALGQDGTLYASTYGKRPAVMALDADDGSEKWRFAIEPGEGDYYGIQSGVLVDSDGFVYFGGRDHYIYCLSPKGEKVWRYKTGDQVDSCPVLGPNGTLYVGSDDHRLYAFGKGE